MSQDNFELPTRVMWFEVAFFVATLVVGILSAQQILTLREMNQIPATEPVSIAQLIGSLVVATSLIIAIPVLVKKRRFKAGIFRTLFSVSIFFGLVIALSLWIHDVLALPLAALLVWLRLKRPTAMLHNVVLILAMAGLASILGLNFHPTIIMWLLVAFSVYDVIAVYKTKHMVKMATEMTQAGAVLGFMVPTDPSDFTESVEHISAGGKFFMLGGGDVVFPVLMSVAVVPFSVAAAYGIAIFSLLGLIASLYIFSSQKIRAAIPALPPIALFTITGYLIVQLLGWV